MASAAPEGYDKLTLVVEILKATNLYDSDGMFAGKSDPYCICSLKGSRDKHAQVRTKTINNNLNPEWNFSGEIKGFDSAHDVLEFEVWDDDFGKDTLLGKAEIPAAELSFQHECTLTLKECKHAQGELVVKISAKEDNYEERIQEYKAEVEVEQHQEEETSNGQEEEERESQRQAEIEQEEQEIAKRQSTSSQRHDPTVDDSKRHSNASVKRGSTDSVKQVPTGTSGPPRASMTQRQSDAAVSQVSSHRQSDAAVPQASTPHRNSNASGPRVSTASRHSAVSSPEIGQSDAQAPRASMTKRQSDTQAQRQSMTQRQSDAQTTGHRQSEVRAGHQHSDASAPRGSTAQRQSDVGVPRGSTGQRQSNASSPRASTINSDPHESDRRYSETQSQRCSTSQRQSDGAGFAQTPDKHASMELPPSAGEYRKDSTQSNNASPHAGTPSTAASPNAPSSPMESPRKQHAQTWPHDGKHPLGHTIQHLSHIPASPRYTFRPVLRDRASDVPGPGQYTHDGKLRGTTAAAVTKRNQYKVPSVHVGPGSYEIPSGIGNGQKSAMHAPQKTKPSAIPGPGTYETKSGPCRTHTMGYNRSARENTVPGPGAYEPEHHLTKPRSPKSEMGSSHRDRNTRSDKIPGPETYLKGSTLGNSMKVGLSMPLQNRLELTPGPGHYGGHWTSFHPPNNLS